MFCRSEIWDSAICPSSPKPPPSVNLCRYQASDSYQRIALRRVAQLSERGCTRLYLEAAPIGNVSA